MSDDRSLGEMLIQAAREMVAVHRGEMEPARVHYRVRTGPYPEFVEPPFYSADRIREIREKMKLSQAMFAEVLNCRPSAVKAWEEDRREPDAASRRLLQLADRHPDALLALIPRADPEHGEAPAEEPKLRRAG